MNKLKNNTFKELKFEFIDKDTILFFKYVDNKKYDLLTFYLNNDVKIIKKDSFVNLLYIDFKNSLEIMKKYDDNKNILEPLYKNLLFEDILLKDKFEFKNNKFITETDIQNINNLFKMLKRRLKPKDWVYNKYNFANHINILNTNYDTLKDIFESDEIYAISKILKVDEKIVEKLYIPNYNPIVMNNILFNINFEDIDMQTLNVLFEYINTKIYSTNLKNNTPVVNQAFLTALNNLISVLFRFTKSNYKIPNKEFNSLINNYYPYYKKDLFKIKKLYNIGFEKYIELIIQQIDKPYLNINKDNMFNTNNLQLMHNYTLISIHDEYSKNTKDILINFIDQENFSSLLCDYNKNKTNINKLCKKYFNI